MAPSRPYAAIPDRVDRPEWHPVERRYSRAPTQQRRDPDPDGDGGNAAEVMSPRSPTPRPSQSRRVTSRGPVGQQEQRQPAHHRPGQRHLEAVHMFSRPEPKNRNARPRPSRSSLGRRVGVITIRTSTAAARWAMTTGTWYGR